MITRDQDAPVYRIEPYRVSVPAGVLFAALDACYLRMQVARAMSDWRPREATVESGRWAAVHTKKAVAA